MAPPRCVMCGKQFSDRKSLVQVDLLGFHAGSHAVIEVCKACADGLRLKGKRR